MAKPSKVVSLRSDRAGGSGSGYNGNGNGNPPTGNDMEKRVEKLEQTVTEIQIRLVKLDSRLDNIEKQMATKSDLQELSVSLHKALNDQTWKFISVAAVLAGLAFTAARFIPGG